MVWAKAMKRWKTNTMEVIGRARGDGALPKKRSWENFLTIQSSRVCDKFWRQKKLQFLWNQFRHHQFSPCPKNQIKKWWLIKVIAAYQLLLKICRIRRFRHLSGWQSPEEIVAKMNWQVLLLLYIFCPGHTNSQFSGITEAFSAVQSLAPGVKNVMGGLLAADGVHKKCMQRTLCNQFSGEIIETRAEFDPVKRSLVLVPKVIQERGKLRWIGDMIVNFFSG